MANRLVATAVAAALTSGCYLGNAGLSTRQAETAHAAMLLAGIAAVVAGGVEMGGAGTDRGERAGCTAAIVGGAGLILWGLGGLVAGVVTASARD